MMYTENGYNRFKIGIFGLYIPDSGKASEAVLNGEFKEVFWILKELSDKIEQLGETKQVEPPPIE